jgi:ATP-dependent Clp protease ATP-binding subunit ClpC
MAKTYDTIDQDRVFKKFTQNAQKAIIHSYDLARKDSQNIQSVLEPKHLFVAILEEQNNLAARLLERLGVDLAQTSRAVLANQTSGYNIKSVVPTEDYKKIISNAFMEAAQLSHVYVGCEHLLLAMLKFEELPFIEDLVNSGLNYERIRQEILQFGTYQPGVFSKQLPAANQLNQGNQLNQLNQPSQYDQEEIQEGEAGGALASFGVSMTEQAAENKFLPILGRDEEIERVLHILSRQTKNNPILVGEAGVGKTAVVEGIAQRIIQGRVPKAFRGKDIVRIDIASIIAGAKIRGDVEERIMAIMDELQADPSKIIFIDEIHMIVGTGSAGGSSDMANILKPYLTNSEMQIIGATTIDEYRKYFEEDSALARRFQPVDVKELGEEESIAVLRYLAPTFEKFHKVSITDDAVTEAVKLSKRYITDRYLPDKAIDLVDEAAAKKKIIRQEKENGTVEIQEGIKQLGLQKGQALNSGNLDLASTLRQQEIALEIRLQAEAAKSEKVSKKHKVLPEDIREIVSRWTKIPVTSLTAMEIKSVEAIRGVIENKIIGQKDATERIAAALKRAKLGFTSPNRPMASFLFLGPTGVGKTETAKVIARELFGSEDALIQINMSEYMEAHSVSKLIGAPPGYVGYSDGNHITEQVRKTPYSVVLFDEIEKAHLDLLNLLLQILEEGYVQDSKGRKVSFKNTIIILTSNIGAREIAQDNTLGFNTHFDDQNNSKKEEAYDEMRGKVMSQLKDHLRPEFINRIDEIIVFRGLGEEDAFEIAKLQVEELNGRLQERFLHVQPAKELVKQIAKDGFDAEYGARNIRRKVQEVLENKLADYILENRLVPEIQKRQKKGGELFTINAGLVDGKVQFS